MTMPRPNAQPRPRNALATRMAILEAARVIFAREGFDNAGVREIAARAGVNLALISRYFGGKEGLFRAVLIQTAGPEDVFCGDPKEFSAKIAQLAIGDAPNPAKLEDVQVLLRSAFSSGVAEVVREVIDERFYKVVAKWLGGDDAIPKAMLLFSILMGFGAVQAINSDAPLSPTEKAHLRQRLQRVICAAISDSSC